MPQFSSGNKASSHRQHARDSEPLPHMWGAEAQAEPTDSGSELWSEPDSTWTRSSGPLRPVEQWGEHDVLTPPLVPALPAQRMPGTTDPYPVVAAVPDARLRKVGGRLISTDPTIPDILPHDAQEFGRLNFQHHLLTMALKGLHSAPIDRSPISVGETRFFLDVGCGTGKWCQDIADACKDAAVLGIDPFSPGVRASSQQYLYRAANVLVEHDPGLEQLNPQTFDYIHVRDMALAIPGVDSLAVIQRLEWLLKQNGWLEWIEFNPPMTASDGAAPGLLQPIRRLGEWASAAASTRRGLMTDLGASLVSSMQEAGLLGVEHVEKPLPMGMDIAAANASFYENLYGTQAKRIGKLTLANWMERMVSLRPIILSLHLQGCTPEVFDQTLVSVPDALTRHAQKGGNCYWPVIVVCAQKTRIQFSAP